jgi:hypothetical protein
MLKFEPIIFGQFVKDVQKIGEENAMFVTNDLVVNFGRIVEKEQ